jgi:hypothetical protein
MGLVGGGSGRTTSYYERRDLERRTNTAPHVPTTQAVARVELVPL